MTLVETYNEFINFFPGYIGASLNLLILVLLIVLYAIFIWKFYRFISTKNLLGLDLNKYNKSENSFSTKILAGALYFLEYLVIIPFIIFIVYVILTFFLMILSQNSDITLDR